jgi:NADP-dependent 3-hydroxy acid dehydrogenase YdfG
MKANSSFSKAIVVGASSGIGAAIAKQLAEAGADVAILARRASELDALAASRPEKLKPYAHDATDVDSVPELFERIVRELGGLDTLVYAAGVMPKLEES